MKSVENQLKISILCNKLTGLSLSAFYAEKVLQTDNILLKTCLLHSIRTIQSAATPEQIQACRSNYVGMHVCFGLALTGI